MDAGELRIEYVPVGELKPYGRNAKKHTDEQVDRIAASIREFGFRQPLVVDADGVIVIGHGRLMAAKKLGLERVPVTRADDLTESQIKALRLADNKANESQWDFAAMEDELKDLDGEIDMEEFGFTLQPLDFESFDGAGDGGGSQIGNGDKVRVVIGALMFDIPDPTHEIYGKTKEADAETAAARIADMIARGELL